MRGGGQCAGRVLQRLAGRRDDLLSEDAGLAFPVPTAGQSPIHHRRSGRPGGEFRRVHGLGDYHELLVTNRIWTEAQHIEQRLTDLTEHMENVIQKYLANEFETIEEYNTMAGEVAEPFRVLVVANFPTNFNDAALRRLISIVNSGTRCGVYALVMYDTKLGLPSGFQLKELEGPCVQMIWKEGRLQWREPNFGRYPLALDAPPNAGRFSEILHKVGVAAATPTASRCRSHLSLPKLTSTGASTAARESISPWDVRRE